MYKNNIIIFISFVFIFLVSSLYFSSKIQTKQDELIKKQEQLTKYKKLQNKYSKKSLSNEQKKLMDILELFDVKFSTKKDFKNKTKLSMELKKTDLDKVISYILESNLIIKTMKIKKIDNYTAKMDVSFE